MLKVVFCTAYDQYAVQAFEEHAVDYLLKPVARPRLERALNRVREALAGRGSYRNEREEAREAQSRLYPGRLPGMATLDFGGICRPALGVGGDYYDFLPLGPGRLGIAVGDVCGKGMPAALLMAAVQGRLQASAAHFEDDLAGLFRDLNHHLCAATGGARFVTLCYGVYDEADRSFRYVNAGHNPPLLWPGEAEADGGPILLEAGGVVLGLLEEAEYSVGSVPLQANDTLVLFTDGVTEATNRAEAEFGLDRLVALVERERRGDAAGLLGAIEATVEAFLQGAPLHDDFTLVVAKGK